MTAIKKSTQQRIRIILLIGILIFINVLANSRIGGQALYGYLDLTEEKRFSLTNGTRVLLRNLDDVVYVRVLFAGEFPAGFKRLQTATREMLEDFQGVNGLVEFQFENPTDDSKSTEEINATIEELSKDGIIPTRITIPGSAERSERIVFPYAIFNYKGREYPVNILENDVPGTPKEVILNNSVALLEYKFANAIQKLQSNVKPGIVFTTGQGELPREQTADLERSLREFYNTGRVNLDSVPFIPEEVSALVVAKPRAAFSERDKFKIDQYVMKGGKVLWLIDPLAVSLDSLRNRQNYIPPEYPINLEDLLFRYGIRINSNLVLDLQSTRIQLATGRMGNSPQFEYFPYPYHLVVTNTSDHPIVKGVGPINMTYASTVDTALRTKTPLRKEVLLSSSGNTRLQFSPIRMDFEFLRYELQPDKFDKGPQPVGLLLEGTFPSLYTNRVTDAMLAGLQEMGQEFRTESVQNRMIVVSDGDIAKNDFRNGEVTPLGYNRFEKYTFANKDFLVNAIEYLLDENGVIEARGKEVKLRLLDTAQAKEQAQYWRFINIGAPLLFLGLFGLGFNYLRRRRYA